MTYKFPSIAINGESPFIILAPALSRSSGLIDVGLVKLKPHSNSHKIKVAIQKYLPSDIKVFTKQEWIDFEKNYGMTSTAIGYSFTLGVGMGLIVGIVIVYQILYTDVASHLKEYATLNAMGYKYQYFLIVVFQEAIILAMMGYIPGFIIASFLYTIARNSTLLPIAMTQSRIFLVFILTITMCFLAGVIAIKKLKDVANHYGLEEGKPIFFAGHRAVTDEELEEQTKRLELGLVPDEQDLPAMMDYIKEIREMKIG